MTTKKLEIRYIPTELKPADIFTKALSEPRLQSLRSKLTMEDSTYSLRGGIEGIEPEDSGSFVCVTSAREYFCYESVLSTLIKLLSYMRCPRFRIQEFSPFCYKVQ